MEVAGEEEEEKKVLSEDEAIIIILAHGCLQHFDVDVPECVTDFKKKNVAACGYYAMRDLSYAKTSDELLDDIIENGLDDSFPQIEDVRAMRLKENIKVRPTRPVGWQTHKFGPSDMVGECSTGVCISHNKRKLINKLYRPERMLPIVFYYGNNWFDLFNIDYIFDLLKNIKQLNGRESKKEIGLLGKEFNNQETPTITTKLMMDFVRLLHIKKLSILDFSCSALCDANRDEPAHYIPVHEDFGLGKTRTRKSKKKRNNNNKNKKKKRKTRK